MHQQLLKIILVFSFLSTIVWSSKIESLQEAINISGKQRMFTQRMLKDYAMIGMRNKFGNPEKDLQIVIKNFDDDIILLSHYIKNKAIKKEIAVMNKLWIPIKKLLSEDAEKEKIVSLQEDLDILLKKANSITKSLAKLSSKKSDHIINISGKQRMLSQRMASLYMLRVWGITDSKFKVKLEKAMTNFKEALIGLKASNLNTPKINKLLSKVERSFKFFEFMGRSNSKFIPSLIYRKSNDMLKNMNTVTELYVTLHLN